MINKAIANFLTEKKASGIPFHTSSIEFPIRDSDSASFDVL